MYSVFSFFASAAIGKYGKYTLFEIVSAAIAAVAGGLIYTLDIETSLGKQIGYQILLGLGIGLVAQIPPIVAGVVNTNADKAVGLGAVLGETITQHPFTMPAVLYPRVETLANQTPLHLIVTQFYSASLVITASSAITNNLLIQKVPIYAPETTPAEVLAIGPYDLEAHFSGDNPTWHQTGVH
ncbi:hypothetical protein GGR58DRAFT_527907 [Xylaria digitata]|nr:hypothetical protein GGR58DRAFT_527907 [Xylaria digitata]